ncbi:MAG: hypothetical protein QM760_11325 [Nibricoccus sp.]
MTRRRSSITASEQQVEFAISTADLILFVIDGLERHHRARSENRADAAEEQEEVLPVVNKADFDDDKIHLD